MSRFLLIGMGAALGANARYLVSVWAAQRFGVGFPYGTFIVNLTGSLLLGFVVTLAAGGLRLSPEARLLLAVGFLGSYTTFSAYTVESLALWQEVGLWQSVLNVAGQNILGLVFAVLGTFAARAFT